MCERQVNGISWQNKTMCVCVQCNGMSMMDTTINNVWQWAGNKTIGGAMLSEKVVIIR